MNIQTATPRRYGPKLIDMGFSRRTAIGAYKMHLTVHLDAAAARIL
jgi:hypothetical protein